MRRRGVDRAASAVMEWRKGRESQQPTTSLSFISAAAAAVINAAVARAKLRILKCPYTILNTPWNLEMDVL